MSVYIENYVPVVKFQGLNTQKNVTMEGTLAVTGVATFTAAPVFTAAPSGPQVSISTNSATVGATVVLTAAQSGQTFINVATSGSPSWTLPAALTNTQATAVKGDTITLQSDGTAWWMTSQSGIFAAA